MKCKRTVLPLLGTAFEPGRLADTLNEFEDEELAEIAQAEAYFFSAQAEACVKIVEKCADSYSTGKRIAVVKRLFALSSRRSASVCYESVDSGGVFYRDACLP